MNSISLTAQFSHPVVSDSLWPRRLHHVRLPCPSPTPGACSNSCPLSRWCRLTISSSVIPFSSCFPWSQFFASGGQRIGTSVSASVLPMNIQDWSPLEWTGWISLQSKGLSRVFPMKWWDRMPWSSFSECWALSQLFHSPLSLSSRGFLVPLPFLP